MKKFLLVLAAAALIPASVSACTYENIKLENGTVKARWTPCNDESCPDYQQHKKMIENQNVHTNDVAPAKPVDRFATANIKIGDLKEVKKQPEKAKQEKKKSTKEQQQNTGKVYDKKQHRERDVDAINAENEAIDKVTGELPEAEHK